MESSYIAAEEQRGNALKLIQALEQLTGKQKEVIFLRYFEELSYEDQRADQYLSEKLIQIE